MSQYPSDISGSRDYSTMVTVAVARVPSSAPPVQQSRYAQQDAGPETNFRGIHKTQ
jgi:hypothetical protein